MLVNGNWSNFFFLLDVVKQLEGNLLETSEVGSKLKRDRNTDFMFMVRFLCHEQFFTLGFKIQICLKT